MYPSGNGMPRGKRTPSGLSSEMKLQAVLGFSQLRQLRSTFRLSYINMERARAYDPILNYNTWYDIGYFTPLQREGRHGSHQDVRFSRCPSFPP